MGARSIRSVIASVAVIPLLLVPLTAQRQTPAATVVSVPRTQDGHPDLTGYWQSPTTQGGAMLEEYTGDPNDPVSKQLYLPFQTGRGRTFGGQVIDRATGKRNGTIPYQEWALQKRQENLDQILLDPHATCGLDGVPRQMYNFGARQILQTRDTVTILNEHVHGYRVIALDGRPHIGKDLKLWMGDSVGHWEANALVVETTNHNGKTWLSSRGDFHTDQAKVIERFIMVDANTIEYEVTIEDPKAFTRPWTMAFPHKRLVPGQTPERALNGIGNIDSVPDTGFELLEDACFEGDWNPQTLSPNAGHTP